MLFDLSAYSVYLLKITKIIGFCFVVCISDACFIKDSEYDNFRLLLSNLHVSYLLVGHSVQSNTSECCCANCESSSQMSI